MNAMRKYSLHVSTFGRSPLKLVAKVKVQAFGDMTLRVKLDQIRFYSNGKLVNLDKAHQILRDETSNQFGMVHNDQTFKKMLTAPFLLHIKRGVVKKMIVSRNEPAEVTEIKKLLASNLEKKSGQVHLQLLMKTAIIIPLETPRFPMKIDIGNYLKTNFVSEVKTNLNLNLNVGASNGPYFRSKSISFIMNCKL